MGTHLIVSAFIFACFVSDVDSYSAKKKYLE